MPQFDLKNATLKIKDGGANFITVNIGEGNFTYSVKRNIEYKLNRGKIAGDVVRLGDEVPCDVSFDFIWEYIEGIGGTPTVEDALNKQGAASGWTSTATDICEPYAVDLELQLDNNCGTNDIETLTFADFRYESIDHDSRAGTIACSGKCNIIQPDAVRSS